MSRLVEFARFLTLVSYGCLRFSMLCLAFVVTVGCDTGVTPDDTRSTESAHLLNAGDLEYVGAFRLPASEFGASSLNYSQGPIDVVDRSLLIVGHAHHQAIAEFAIPDLVDSETLGDLNMASAPVQPFSTVLDRVANPQGLDRIGGLERLATGVGTTLVVNAFEYYDAPADNTHTTLIVRDASALASSTVDGPIELEGAAHASGWLSNVPMEWRPSLGHTMLAGASSGWPIMGRWSVGPSAFGLDPDALLAAVAGTGTTATEPLLDYNLSQPLAADLLNEGQTNSLWTHLSRAVYGFIVPGTATYLVLGHSGGHGASGVCYKCTPMGEQAPCGGYCSVDPNDNTLFYWMYDVADLVRVRGGELAPFEVRPYESGPLTAPFSTSEMGGASFDEGSGLLYVSLLRADREQGTYSNPPVVVAFSVAN